MTAANDLKRKPDRVNCITTQYLFLIHYITCGRFTDFKMRYKVFWNTKTSRRKKEMGSLSFPSWEIHYIDSYIYTFKWTHACRHIQKHLTENLFNNKFLV